MAEHPYLAIYREVHEQLQQGDFGAAFDALDVVVLWHQLGAETLHGKQAVMDSMCRIEELGATKVEHRSRLFGPFPTGHTPR